MQALVAARGSIASRPSTRPPRRLERLATVILVTALLLAAVAAGGAAVGYRSQVVLTGSMRPALDPGDMIIVRRAAASDVRSGEIISFAHPTQANVVMTHRVRSMRMTGSGRRVRIVTQGDANDTPERWAIAADGDVGRVVGVLPGVGKLTSWTRRPAAQIVVFAVLGAALLGFGLRWAWRL